MSKKIWLIVLLLICILLGTIVFMYEGKQVKLIVGDGNELRLSVTVQERSEMIDLWYKAEEGVYYFFLPSFVDSHYIYMGNDGGKEVTINGKLIGWNDKFEWEEGVDYEIVLSGKESREAGPFHIVFVKSQNLPTVFLETESGSMEYIDRDKENMERGFIDVVKEDGTVDHYGKLNKISGRGNSTWNLDKKPYAFTLEKEVSLCGMSNSKKWKLLALAYEGSKMNNKLIYDMANALGIVNTTDAVWIDLYLNGKYNGIYMLNEAIDVGESSVNIHDLEKDNEYLNPSIEKAEVLETEEGKKGYQIVSPNNISGGYLLEVDNIWWNEDENYFRTEFANYYVIHEPEYPSTEEYEYIKQYIESIETRIFSGNKEFRNYVDIDSIVKRFLIDEISLNIDAGYTSMYFYKDQDDDLVFAGPVWDYDMSFGECNMWENTRTLYTMDYEATTISYTPANSWQRALYWDSEFQEKLIQYYKELLPYMQELIDYKIDEYANQIEASVNMDSIRWKKFARNYPGHYLRWENDVRYIKFFLAKRLNYLNQNWNISYEDFSIPSDGSVHKVAFIKDGEVLEEKQVMDGEVIMDLPYLDENEYNGWFYAISRELFREKIPVYEDMEIYADKR